MASLKNRNAELDEKRKKALKDYYETGEKLEEAQGLIVKLTAFIQMHRPEKNHQQPGTEREEAGRPAGASPSSTQEACAG